MRRVIHLSLSTCSIIALGSFLCLLVAFKLHGSVLFADFVTVKSLWKSSGSYQNVSYQDSSFFSQEDISDDFLREQEDEEELRVRTHGLSHGEADCFQPRRTPVVKFLIERMKAAENEMLERAKNVAFSDSPDKSEVDIVEDNDDEMFVDMSDTDMISWFNEDDSEFPSATSDVGQKVHLHASAELRREIFSEDISCAEPEQQEIVSSVECFGSRFSSLGRYCRFQNVCYRDSSIVYFPDPESVDDDVPSEVHVGVGYRTRGRGSMIRTHVLDANSLEKNRWFAKWTPCWVEKPSYIFSRSWNNYYFTVYSAFGLHATLKEQHDLFPYNFSRDDVILFNTDRGAGRGAPSGLFDVFSDVGISFLSDLDRLTDIGICFKDVVVGLTKKALLGEDIWFDPAYCPVQEHGGDQPSLVRRPVIHFGRESDMNWRKYVQLDAHDTSPATPDEISKRSILSQHPECHAKFREEISKRALLDFKDFVVHKHGLTAIDPASPDASGSRYRILLLSRRRRRVIINEQELVTQLQRLIPNCDVTVVSFESMPFHEQINLVRRAHLLIGMHGAGFANAIWLTKMSAIIELFPYRYYKPTYQLLAAMANVRHDAWKNGDIRTTRVDWTRLGPIGQRLSSANQTRIMLMTRYPGIGDQSLRNFFKNQDTIVDPVSLSELVREVLRIDEITQTEA